MPEQWLVHFTDHAWKIVRDGFKYGSEEADRLGLTTWRKKHGPGYNFAFELDDVKRYSTDNASYRRKQKYGQQAVIFRSPGNKIFHIGDNEPQVIFYGPSARRPFIPVSKDQDLDKWVINTDSGTSRT